MENALREAETAYKQGEVPVGALVADLHGTILSSAYNQKEKDKDASAHAELIALRAAAKKKKDWRLTDCVLFVTLEPCPMCLSAILQYRLAKVIFGAYDPKGGAISLGYEFHKDPRLNHTFDVMGGVLHYECSQLISNFFKERRAQYQNINS
ncbi:MAG: nucleoside deaminase [Halobacteriovoraceae bacterium]|nr:nucleoside deaminase [Halobacteriovoraceae bacterium]